MPIWLLPTNFTSVRPYCPLPCSNKSPTEGPLAPHIGGLPMHNSKITRRSNPQGRSGFDLPNQAQSVADGQAPNRRLHSLPWDQRAHGPLAMHLPPTSRQQTHSPQHDSYRLLQQVYEFFIPNIGSPLSRSIAPGAAKIAIYGLSCQHRLWRSVLAPSRHVESAASREGEHCHLARARGSSSLPGREGREGGVEG